MYNAHFGLREKPFKLVPNPDFLYMSKSHEVALAHLSYAVSQGDGFVVITGEVGTGKTTLCRIFLERLDDSVESAYIFNPKLDSVELLTSICNEFGLRTGSKHLKQLLDEIYGYLISKHQDGRNVILLIDEAQNLSIENLEMVRMLSNLETTRSKLLQIILVGQPELGDKLDSYELRQLAQRISLSAHLTPMGYTETVGYIRHRVNIAAQRQLELFTRSAFRRIHRFSRGIPRLINIACDRALLSAFSLGRNKVTGAVAALAIQELVSRGRMLKPPIYKKVLAWTAVAMAVLIAAGIVYLKKDLIGPLHSKPSPAAEALPATGNDDAAGRLETEPASIYKVPPLTDTGSPGTVPFSGAAAISEADDPAHTGVERISLKTAVEALDPHRSRLDAVARVLACWQQTPPHDAQLPPSADDADYFAIAARQYGLRMHTVQSNLGLVKQLNLPAFLALEKGDGQIVYMAMVEWRDGRIRLAGTAGGDLVETSSDELLPYLHGPIYLYWNDTLEFDGLIGEGSPPEPVMAVKKLLRRVGYDGIDSQPVFDQETRQAVIDFQVRNRIAPDGLIGPLTKIFLIQTADTGACPRLDETNGRSGA